MCIKVIQKINSVFDCEVEPENISEHAILVSKKLQKEKVVVGHDLVAAVIIFFTQNTLNASIGCIFLKINWPK